MLVGVYLDPIRYSTTSKSVEGLQKVGFMKPLFWLTKKSSFGQYNLCSGAHLPPTYRGKSYYYIQFDNKKNPAYGDSKSLNRCA